MMLEKCNCGRDSRYSHRDINTDKIAYSCNKYQVCPTYDQLLELRDLQRKKIVSYESALNKIITTDAEAYEYKAWAKGATKD